MQMQLVGEPLLEAVSEAVLVIYGEHYGRVPTRVNSYLNDNVLVCVLEEDVLLPEEKARVWRGLEEAVLEQRASFQREHQADFTLAVERLTGRRVKAFLSANQTKPGAAAELFILEGQQPDRL